jgi:hypothetical protein
VGGLLVTVAYGLCNTHSGSFPAIFGEHAVWRYTLISGVIPALPLIVIRPFLPESPVWAEKRAAGTLKRPSVGALFKAPHFRTTIVTALLFACSYGAAFGAIQFTPQIVPGLNKAWAPLPKLRKELDKAEAGSAQATELKKQIRELNKDQQDVVKTVQLWQEFGGLLGRFVLAWLAVRIARRGRLLRIFQVPGLFIVPLVFLFPAAGKVPESILGALHTDNLGLLKIGIFVVGFLTVAQFSFWGNYLPRVYPVHLRGTGEGFAANVGGRMVGTAANALTGLVFGPIFLSHLTGMTPPGSLAYAAAATGLIVYAVGVVASFWLPEPSHDDAHE